MNQFLVDIINFPSFDCEHMFICTYFLTNPMCKFFKRPTDPIEAEEPDLAH